MSDTATAREQRRSKHGECCSTYAFGICKFAGEIIVYGSFEIEHLCGAPTTMYHSCPYSASNNIMIPIYDANELD